MTTLLILYIASGLLLAALSLPLVAGKIKPNPIYGFRVRRTLEDPAVWYPANRYAGKQLLAAGLGVVLAAAALYAVPGIGLDAYALACLAVMGAMLAAAVYRSFRYLNRITG